MKDCSLSLGSVAHVSSGYTFRGAIKPAEDSDVRVVQMSDVTPDRPIDWSALTRTELPGQREPDWLQSDDIIFVTRGWSNFALHLPVVPVQAVCSPHFAVIRVQHSAISPSFLAWQINQAPAQAFLDSVATGTSQRSIPVSGLKALPVSVLRHQLQERIVQLHEACVREREVYQALVANRETEMRALAAALLGGGGRA